MNIQELQLIFDIKELIITDSSLLDEEDTMFVEKLYNLGEWQEISDRECERLLEIGNELGLI